LTGEVELSEALKEMLGNPKALEARQKAVKDAFSIMSDGVVNRVWNLVSMFAVDSQQKR
jgi:3-deoxy-D-manno-octulosonic-acid transferase